jgi:hypothetical protein
MNNHFAITPRILFFVLAIALSACKKASISSNHNRKHYSFAWHCCDNAARHHNAYKGWVLAPFDN